MNDNNTKIFVKRSMTLEVIEDHIMSLFYFVKRFCDVKCFTVKLSDLMTTLTYVLIRTTFILVFFSIIKSRM